MFIVNVLLDNKKKKKGTTHRGRVYLAVAFSKSYDTAIGRRGGTPLTYCTNVPPEHKHK